MRAHHAPPPVSAYTPTVAQRGAYMPQLDGLRCFAVLIVVWQHAGAYAGARTFSMHGFGVYGVWLFFVLSAFLISGILLRLRDDRTASRGGLGAPLRVFYARRALRIVPAYYLFLALAVLLAVPFIHGELVAHLLYLTRQMVPGREPWPGPVEHLWSLAVEEQFYLVWPFLMLALPAQWIPRVLLVVIGSGVVLRGALTWGAHTAAFPVLLSAPGALDAFGVGALLAWHWHVAPDAQAERERMLRRAIVVALTVLLAVFVAILGPLDVAAWLAVEPCAFMFVAAWLVNRAALGAGALVLGARPVRYVGSISYGIYLYHTLVVWVLTLTRQATDGRPAPWMTEGALPYVLLVYTITFAIAALSARYVERPITALKRYATHP